MPEIKIEIPYTTVLSKNKSHRNISINKRVPVKAYTEMLKGIGLLIKGKLNRYGIKFEAKKLWLCITIYKPDMRADPLNFVDGIADGVKKALAVDDRYYSAVIDWELDKVKPRIEITIKQ